MKNKIISIISVVMVLGVIVGIFTIIKNELKQQGAENTPEEIIINEPTVADEDTSLGGDTSTVQEEFKEEVPVAIAGGAYTISGKKISGWNVQKRWPIASVTKLVAAYVGEQLLEPTDRVTFNEEAIAVIGESGNFKVGDTFQVRDLVKSMMMVSSNDASYALADYYGQEAFVQEMNRVAAMAGAPNTRFVEPTGLSVENQSTIEDLVAIANFIYGQDSKIFDISRKSTDLIVDTNTGQIRQLISINQFAGMANFLGGKTGRLPEADGNLLSLFRVAGYDEPIVIVVLGSQNRFEESLSILNSI